MKKQTLINSLFIIGMIAITSAIFFWPSDSASSEALQEDVKTPLVDKLVMDLINQERIDRGIEPLNRDPHVQLSAQLKADHMATHNYYSHEIPGLGYTLTEEMYLEVSKSCKDGASTENIAALIPNDTPEALVSAWMDSEDHKSAILNPEFNISGLAISEDSMYAVQHFCIAK